jgi:branched-chain amino acid aminotransferase
MSVWWRGRVLAGDEPSLAIDRGLLLGDGLFETVHVRDGVAEFLDRHMARLRGSTSALGVPLPAELATTIAEALPRLVVAAGSPPRGALRITATRGTGRGLAPTPTDGGLVLSFDALPDAPRAEPAPAWDATVVDVPRVDPRDPLARHKVLSRMARVEARRTALAAGADVALLVTIDGDVVEGDAANLFVVLGREIVTPPLDRGVLAGITRARCLEAAARRGRTVVERRVELGELADADEALLTSSLDGVRPLRRVGARSLAAPGEAAAWLARCIDLDARDDGRPE